MNKEIFINESMGETRIAIQEDNQLVEVYIEKQDNHRMVGNVYKGKVENVLPGMQAAFVDVGYELNAFLPFSEIGSDEYIIEDNGGRKGRNSKNHKYDNIEVDHHGDLHRRDDDSDDHDHDNIEDDHDDLHRRSSSTQCPKLASTRAT